MRRLAQFDHVDPVGVLHEQEIDDHEQAHGQEASQPEDQFVVHVALGEP